MKMDKKFYGEIRKVKDDSIVPEDQWICFLVKDNAFAAIIPEYYRKCVELGCDEEHLRAVQQMLKDIEEWRALNPSKLKNPDARGEKLLP